MKYTAILFAVDPFGGETFTLSREVDTDDCAQVYAYMKAEGQVQSDQVDTILLVKSACDAAGYPTAPEVFKHWTSYAANFEGLP